MARITDEALIEFKQLWDECNYYQRLEFMKKCTPKLLEWEAQGYAKQPAGNLPRTVLVVLCMVFNGDAMVEPEKDDE